MINIIENLAVTSEKDTCTTVVPTWIEGNFFEGSMGLGGSHERIGHENFLVSREFGEITDLA